MFHGDTSICYRSPESSELLHSLLRVYILGQQSVRLIILKQLMLRIYQYSYCDFITKYKKSIARVFKLSKDREGKCKVGSSRKIYENETVEIKGRVVI
jgi:hypothetical protein